MTSFIKRITGTKAGKAGVVAALSAAAIGLAAPMSSAANESNWTAGCRGYWYSTSGHAYCYDALRQSNTGFGYQINYNCNNEVDKQHWRNPGRGYEGKMSTYECTFKINGTRVS
ncbi:hypothetical protein N7925_35980 [Streptomyces sp. CA-278952]|uniref:hypothetical protein n=1 Tax=unclassified Streptomyces TaxID=2593676 RepID=UPI0022418A0A|nr:MULTISPECIES: hypothetical protein [unclassified Streptomyces]UZI33453.1 hypothetical protein OH133_38235 [Streptomyces sp. VB1]WDG33341.1 hypothetical protein N7925_35980 [Streptomyces sp. CA-278952]